MRNKKGNVLLMVLGALAMLMIIGGGGYLIAKDQGAIKSKSIGDDVEKQSDVTPELNVKAYDAENKGTALTEATNLVRRVGDVSWTTFTQGTAFDALPGETYEIVMGVTTSDMTDNAYGPHFITDEIEYEESIVIEKPLYQDEVETSLSATFLNNDDNAAAETFVAGQTQDVYIKFQAGTDEVFGNPYVSDTPNVLCLNLNSTAWDAPVEVNVGGSKLKQVGAPIRHTVSSTHRAYCYEAPVITDEKVKFTLKLNADDSNAPAVDDTAYIYAGGWYIDDEANVKSGVEDHEGNAVGTDAADSATLDFTA